MKIVQSFWSKPMTNGTGRLVNAGGWFNKRLFLYGSVLSALLLERHYPRQTVFITDRFGHDLFVNKLNLNFGEVIVELDELNDLNKTLWAAGKLYSYARMQEHFIHFDQDFFLPRPLSDEALNAPLVAYTSEFSQPKQANIYIPNIASFVHTIPVLSDRIKDFCNYQPKMAYNAGIIGGYQTGIFQELWNVCLEVISNNNKILKQIDCHFFNVVLEQFLFTCLARDNNLPVTCLENESSVLTDARFTSMKFFPLVSSTHIMAEGKCAPSSCTCIPEILRTDYPDYYHTINRVLSNNLI
jgi:hypothetical protein